MCILHTIYAYNLLCIYVIVAYFKRWKRAVEVCGLLAVLAAVGGASGAGILRIHCSLNVAKKTHSNPSKLVSQYTVWPLSKMQLRLIPPVLNKVVPATLVVQGLGWISACPKGPSTQQRAPKSQGRVHQT